MIVSMAENKEREVQGVEDEEDYMYEPLLDELDLETLMEDERAVFTTVCAMHLQQCALCTMIG